MIGAAVPTRTDPPSSLDAEIDALIASGHSLTEHEDLWPSLRALRAWYWSTAFGSRVQAIKSWTALLIAFGATSEMARVEAEAWATGHGYRDRPRPGRVPHRGPGIIDRVKEQISIEVVARELTELRQGRDSLTGRCPFHADQSPSFVVWPARGLWRCYGACAEGGDVVKLWQRAREKGLAR